MITAFQNNVSQHWWAQHVVCVWPATTSMSQLDGQTGQLGGQMHTIWYWAQKWYDACMLRWHVAIVWPAIVTTLSGSTDKEAQYTAYHQSWDLPWVFLHILPLLSHSHCAEYLQVCSDLPVVCPPARHQQQLHQVYDKFTYLASLMWRYSQ